MRRGSGNLRRGEQPAAEFSERNEHTQSLPAAAGGGDRVSSWQEVGVGREKIADDEFLRKLPVSADHRATKEAAKKKRNKRKRKRMSNTTLSFNRYTKIFFPTVSPCLRRQQKQLFLQIPKMTTTTTTQQQQHHHQQQKYT